MASSGFPPGLVIYPEHPNSKPFKDIVPFLPAPGSRHGMCRSSTEQNDLRNIRSGSHGYNQFVNYLAMRRMSLPAQFQDMHNDSILSSSSMDEQWTNNKEFLEFLMSRSSDLKEDYSVPSIVPEFRELHASPSDVHLKDVASINFHLDNCLKANESFRHANKYSYHQETDYDLVYDAPYPSISRHPEGRFSLVDNVAEMKDLNSVLAEFAVIKDSVQCTKQQMLVPHFTWSDAINLQDHVYPSSIMLETVTTSPLKSPKKGHLKPTPKRKTRKATKERNLHRNNSLHAFETILSLMVDKNRNSKSMMNALKKSSPELPQLLTQFSASITGTGLAVMFSLVYKLACGTAPNLFTSGFGVGLFWLSWTVNRLRDTIIYIRKNFSKTGFEEDEMVMRVDKNVKDIVFRAAALMAVLMLRFAST
ncbi:hypothetical protein KSS87_011317 [Heliosperma pusillum]|nr:hypothetical protein KSS87_005675 [Heliosperma pusillum]KAH9617947.1 hypothetical protein KSS87_011317 [Heliosperma pusillum]